MPHVLHTWGSPGAPGSSFWARISASRDQPARTAVRDNRPPNQYLDAGDVTVCADAVARAGWRPAQRGAAGVPKGVRTARRC